MNRINNPAIEDWNELIKRPVFDLETLEERVRSIMLEVRDNGDEALKALNLKFDGVNTPEIKLDISKVQFDVDNDLKGAIKKASANIEKFHRTQKESPNQIETMTGISCWRKSVAIDKVGLYIPGGTAPLFSTLLMLAVPAQIAGCNEIIVCTPPYKDGGVHPVIGFTCQHLGIETIYLTGGAQSIGAMTFGTASIPSVYKIFGPGNQYVTAAKQLAQKYGVAIDMPAGPSEVLIIADGSANAAFVAADLLSQSEHGVDSQVILVSDSQTLLDEVDDELSKQLSQLPRKEIAAKALQNSRSILFKSLDACISFSNLYAPEHLIIATEDALGSSQRITNAGSVFLGKWSCESAGDYASGTNHTLPTNAYARNYSGVSLDSFIKKITFQQLSEEGIRNIGPAIELMAEAEELQAHKNAVTLRLNALKK